MTKVAKYNLFKGLSTVCTVGTPIATLAMFGNFFVEQPSRTMSATAVFAILIAMLFFKDKIAEQWKTPSAFVVALVLFIVIELVENILIPMKYVCIATMVMCGVDEFTFKHFYKAARAGLPEDTKAYEHFGFIFSSYENIMKEAKAKE